MAAGHGGARPGAGRKTQSPTVKRLTPEVINAGLLPLEMILRVGRHMWDEATDPETGEIIDLAKAKEAASFVEPALRFTSPILQATTLTGPNGGPIETRLTDARSELARKLAGAGSAAA